MIRLETVGDREVVARLDERSVRADQELRASVGRLAMRLLTLVKMQKLRGQVLGVRTGRLWSSIAQAVFDESGKVVGKVSTNVFYGVGWELGWPGRADKPTLEQAKSKFSLASPDLFKNGSPKQRSFLRSALRDLSESGVIRTEMDAAAARIAG